MYYDFVSSPLGELTLVANDQGITELHIAGDKYFKGVSEDWQREPNNRFIQQGKAELKEYFAGKRKTFTVPLVPFGTPFQQEVWSALKGLSWGETSNYAAIARVISRPKAFRAVGTAIGRNPICIIIPCHRVLSSDGSLGGYVAGTVCKEKLLHLEG